METCRNITCATNNKFSKKLMKGIDTCHKGSRNTCDVGHLDCRYDNQAKACEPLDFRDRVEYSELRQGQCSMAKFSAVKCIDGFRQSGIFYNDQKTERIGVLAHSLNINQDFYFYKHRKQIIYDFLVEAGMKPNSKFMILGGLGGSGSRGFTKLLQKAGVFVPSSNLPLDWLQGNIFNDVRAIVEKVHSACYDKNSLGKVWWRVFLERRMLNQVVPIAPMLSDYLQSTKDKRNSGKLLPRKDSAYVAIKHGPFAFGLPLFKEIFPDGKVMMINYIRDGRDMAFSQNNYQLVYLGKGLGLFEDEYKDYNTVQRKALMWSRVNMGLAKCLYKLGMDSEHYVSVKFEDFVTSNRTHRINAIKDFFKRIDVVPDVDYEELAKVFDKSVGSARDFDGEAHEKKWETDPLGSTLKDVKEFQDALKFFQYT